MTYQFETGLVAIHTVLDWNHMEKLLDIQKTGLNTTFMVFKINLKWFY